MPSGISKDAPEARVGAALPGESLRRVVVTGLGCVSPLGPDAASTWEAAAAGRSGCREISRFDAREHSVRIAAEVPEMPPLEGLSVKEIRRMDRCTQFALAAADEALAASGLLGEGKNDRVGVAIGSGIGGLETLTNTQDVLREKGPRRVSAFTIPMSISNISGGIVAIHHGLRGPNLCHVSACASGAHAIGESVRIVERGDADAMLAGGTEAPLVELGLAAFASMRALSTRNDSPAEASRPFDRGRDGFVMGEGAAALVIESLEHARSRGAPILAEIVGYGASADAANLAAPDADGAGAVLAMRAALADARLTPEEIDYVNAHATSTPAGDPVEARALEQILGSAVASTPVSATKSMTGHLLGAAGALEALLCVRSIQENLIPPTLNLDDPDPECALDHVALTARETPVEVALSNSFGFGGTNASLVFSSPRN